MGSEVKGKRTGSKNEPDARALFEAFVTGFAVSGEGWNGEYPFHDKMRDIASDPDVRRKFDEYMGSK